MAVSRELGSGDGYIKVHVLFFLLCVLDVFIKNFKDGGRLRIRACCGA